MPPFPPSDEILPIEYDDNYVTVFPGETAEIHGTIWKGDKAGFFKLEGYNIPAPAVPIKYTKNMKRRDVLKPRMAGEIGWIGSIGCDQQATNRMKE